LYRDDIEGFGNKGIDGMGDEEPASDQTEEEADAAYSLWRNCGHDIASGCTLRHSTRSVAKVARI
jgi:hypothetical protein